VAATESALRDLGFGTVRTRDGGNISWVTGIR
jgi:hypothetical protein